MEAKEKQRPTFKEIGRAAGKVVVFTGLLTGYVVGYEFIANIKKDKTANDTTVFEAEKPRV